MATGNEYRLACICLTTKQLYHTQSQFWRESGCRLVSDDNLLVCCFLQGLLCQLEDFLWR